MTPAVCLNDFQARAPVRARSLQHPMISKAYNTLEARLTITILLATLDPDTTPKKEREDSHLVLITFTVHSGATLTQTASNVLTLIINLG